MLSRFVIAFLPRSKHLLIARLQSLSTMILEPKKIKSVTVFIFSPSICHESCPYPHIQEVGVSWEEITGKGGIHHNHLTAEGKFVLPFPNTTNPMVIGC